MALSALLNYLLLVMPLLGLFALWYCLTPQRHTGLRLAIVLIGFICARDLMTPHELWRLGGHPALQFHANGWVLVALGGSSVVLIAVLARCAPALWQLVVAFKGNRATGLAMGVAAGCAIGLPVRLYLGVEVAALPWLLGFAVLAFAGNALEEVLFRGMLQGLLERSTSAQRAAWGSAIAFCACHVYLAFILTSAGWPVMLFTFVEGIACAQIRLRWGTVPAIATHGTAICLIGAAM